MKNGPILLDGAIGTSLWNKSGDHSPVWIYNIEKPDIVAQLHQEYIDAGSEIIMANTFAANRPSVERSSDYTVRDVVSSAVRIAKEAAAGRVKVGLSIGPLPTLIEPYGPLSQEEASEIFAEQISSGMSKKPDLIYMQTFFDLEMLKIAVREAAKYDVPMFCSMSFEKRSRTIMGNSVAQMVEVLTPLGVEAIGLNCSLGPDAALPVMREFREVTDLPLILKPNVGTSVSSAPGKEAQMKYYDAETFVNDLLPALDIGITYLGGCCGSDPTYIALLREKLQAKGSI